MTEQPVESGNPNDLSVQGGRPGNANLIYILYLVSIVIGVTSIVGVVMAYLGRGEAASDPLVRSHYDNQIGIFWKMLLFVVVGSVLTIILIGFLILLGALIWYVVRTVMGMQALSNGQPIAHPGSWSFTTD